MPYARIILPAVLVALHLSATPLDAQTPAAPAPRPTPTVTFSGEVRTRSEWDRPGAPVAADAFTLLRSRFGARVDAGHGTAIVLQIQDSRVLGVDASRSPATPNVLDLHQGYLELGTPWRGLALGARVGRQEIALANERLVGAVNWSNTGRSFDGIRLLARPEGAPGTGAWEASAFAATVEERGRRFGSASAPATASSADHMVAGLFLSRGRPTGASPSAVTLEATALYDGGASYRRYDHADRTTIDARLRAPRVLGVRAELEGAYQVGRQRFTPATPGAASRSQQVSAWLLGARAGTPITPTTRHSATIGVDWLSGDRTPNDGRYGAFSTMFATNHPFYGLMDLFPDPAARTRDRGLVDALANGSITLGPKVSLKGELHHFALATGDDRNVGWEGDVTLPVRLNASATVDVGYSAFRASSGANAIGLGAPGTFRNWGYVQLRVGF